MSIKFEASGDFSQLLAENEKYQRALVRLTEQVERLGKAGDGMQRTSTRGLSALAEKVTKQQATPAQQYKQEAGNLDQAHAAGMISADQHAEAIDRLGAKYSAAADPLNRYRILQDQLKRQLDDGRLSVDGHAAALAQARASVEASASVQERYTLKVEELDRAFKAGHLSPSQYAEKLQKVRTEMASTAEGSDAFALAIARASHDFERGAITADQYEKQLADLSAVATQADSPVDRFQQRVLLLDNELRRGVIDQRAYEQALAKARQEFGAVATPAQKYELAVQQLDAELATGKIDQDEHTAAVKRAEAATKDAGSAVDQHKGGLSGLGSQIAGLAAGYVSWQGALQLAGQALQFVQQETEKAKGSQDALVDSRRNLAQVATSEDDLAGMIDRADKAAAQYGVTRNEAYKVLFNARSEGFEEDYELLLKSAPVIAPEAAAGVAGQVPTLFAKQEQLSAEQAVSGTLLAAGQSRLDFGPLAKALPQAAEGVAITGGGFAETAATLGVLASRFKSGDTAAERIKILASKMGASEEFGGKGLIGGVEALQAAPAAAREEFLGNSVELQAAFKIMSEELPKIKQQTQLVDEEVKRVGTGGPSLLSRQREIALSDPAEQARQRRVQAEIGREIANEGQFATSGSNRQAAVDAELAKMKTENRSGVTQYAAQAMGNLGNLVNADVEQITTAQRVAAGFTSGGFIGALRGAWSGVAEGPADNRSGTSAAAAVQPPKLPVATRQQMSPQSAVTATASVSPTPTAPVSASTPLAVQPAQTVTSPPAAGPDPNTAALLEETRKSRQATEESARQTGRLVDQLANQPRSGASAAAAAPNLQRQGR